MIPAHKELPSNVEAKRARQLNINLHQLEEMELESQWMPSLERHERQFHAHPEQSQSVWDHVLNMGREATRERMFA